MKLRKAIAIITVLTMVLGTFSVSFAEDAPTASVSSAPVFTDVTDHWGKAAVEKWAGAGIINGYEGLFRPDDSITRGEMAVILDNMMDYQVAAQNTFWDLAAGQFYTDAILKANAAGIIKGYDGSVRPTDKITKEEAAVMLDRAFVVADASSTKALLDAAAVSDWAKGAVFGLEAKGYINGYAGYFNPKANITRAEAVTIINNIVKAYYTAAGTYTEDVAGTAVIKVSDVTLKGVTVSENLIIAEGVAKGDATLDSVTVKGETVVRGGGENSIHITGNSNITKVTVEKVGDTVRVVIADGVTVSTVEVAAGEEIIITGTVGTLEVNSPGTTVNAEAATINTVAISGGGSTLNVGASSAITNVTVSSTAEDTKIQTQAGSTVGKVTASAEVTVSGTGSVTNVVLNSGASGSSVTTPNTSTSVSSGVTGVTGGGGTAIPAGSTGKNNASGTGTTVAETPAGGGGGGGTTGGTTPVNHPDFSLSNLTYGGSAVSVTGGIYQIPQAALTTASSQAIGVTVAGSGFDAAKVYSMTVTVRRTAPNSATETATISNLPGALLNQTHTDSYSSLTDLLDYYTVTLAALTGGTPVSTFTPFLQTQGAGYAYTVTFTYSTTGQSGQLDGGVFSFVLN